MAEKLYGGAYLSPFVDAVLDNLTSILEEDDSFLESNNLLVRLQNCLYDVGPVLDDAELKQFSDKKVKKWLVDLQDALFMADDLLDELSTKAAIAATQRDPGNSSSWSRLVDSYIEDNGHMEKVVGKLESVVRRKRYLCLEKSAKVDMSWRIPSTSLVEPSEICGRKEDKEAILKLLLDDDDAADGDLSVIPIVGMGGIGKTTLAQLLYHDDKVKDNFDFRGWVCVSEEFDVVKVTKTVIEAITSSSCNLTDLNLLQLHLKEKLSRQKFFIVLDDVWNENYDDWNSLLKPFQKGVKGSKILITTRNKNVAFVVQTVSPYELSLLSDEDCWLVFSKHARLSTVSVENLTLEKIGRDIVKKCDGLPLAAQALGGILRGNSDIRDWNHLLKSEIWELSNDRINVVPALRISYYFLPQLRLILKLVICHITPKLKYLRALSFDRFPLESVPDSIGELIHLRYLDLSRTDIVTLPESLSNLYNLQTLKLYWCTHLEMLPVGMKDLVNLRHLDIRVTQLREMPKGMSKLKNLQFLSSYVVGKHEENKMKELGALVDLQQSISIDKLENVVNSNEASMARMFDKDGIDSMMLSWSWNKDENTVDSEMERDILDKLRPHTNLKELQIRGYRGTRFPDWVGHSSYHNITKIKLYACRSCCMLPSLGQLPSLKILLISGYRSLGSVGAELYFNQNGESCLETPPFPVLETLNFESLDGWKEWRSLEFNAFPRLRELTIRRCPMLRGDLPNHLPSLQSLQIWNCEQLSCCVPRSPEMTSLCIEGGNEVRIGELPPLLRELSIAGNYHVESAVQAIMHMQLSCLTSLYIADCSSHIWFPVSAIPASLQQLTIRRCRKLKFQMDGHHHSLQKLSIEKSCDSVTSFSLLDSFPNLVHVNINGCGNMECIVVSRSLPCLRSLRIIGCRSLKSVSTLWMAAPQLELLTLLGCPEVDLSPTGDGDPHRSLRYLGLSYSEKLVSSAAFMNSQFHECEEPPKGRLAACLP
ncbi:putative disease resistance RPP13-like protein 1 [Arachis duranensis]|uniref:Disease resistance RPP13-like protein 1 n=1 Tax=Arachis duranensis TaxID=130453 RepID=A0A9C6WTE9_ARADU|nr:putative disease resistance RPP13-like protein 1 [Arachis duranensis]